MAFYCNDSISGTVWQFLAGGAILVGQVDRETELFSGRDVIYIYPDLFTTIIGRYDNGILVSGFMCNIQVSFTQGNYTERFILTVIISDELCTVHALL